MYKSEPIVITKRLDLSELIEMGYKLIPNVNDEFDYPFIKQDSNGKTRISWEKVKLLDIEPTGQSVVKYTAKFSHMGRIFFTSDWKLYKEITLETTLIY